MNDEIVFVPTADMYVAASKLAFHHQLRRSKFWKRMLLLVTIAFLVGLSVAAVLGADPIEAAITTSFGVLGGLVALAIIAGGNYLLLPRRGRRLFMQDRSIAQPTRFTWDEDEMRWASDAGSYRARWQDHHGWAENADMLIFFANERLYRFVPAAVLSEAQRRDIIARVEEARLGA